MNVIINDVIKKINKLDLSQMSSEEALYLIVNMILKDCEYDVLFNIQNRVEALMDIKSLRKRLKELEELESETNENAFNRERL